MKQIKGKNNCTLIIDNNNMGIDSLPDALNLLNNYCVQDRKILILSDIEHTREQKDSLYSEAAKLISGAKIDKLIGIGKDLEKYQLIFDNLLEKEFFRSTDEFLKNFKAIHFKDEAILVTGSETFDFERIINLLQLKSTHTQLSVNISALVHNLNYYRSNISKNMKVMAMVKAFSYGSGTQEIASALQCEGVDYLGVAIVDEAVKLRKEGINMPILVLNSEISSFNTIIEYNLEPEIYNFKLLDAFFKRAEMLPDSMLSIHLKIETGMNRLGFSENQINELVKRLVKTKNVTVKSIFSHLAGSDGKEFDEYTKGQVSKLKNISNKIKSALSYPVLVHILNSSGTERFPEAEFDMVRIGIGLYGFSPNNQEKLRNVSSLVSIISQIKHVKDGESVGYSRKGKLTRNSRIAIVPVGYADGLRRILSNGNWNFIVNNQKVPIIGNICMDMTMIDITDISAEEGDKVIIFGDEQTAGLMAEKLNTIPYEIMTSIAQRVKRVYYH